jgi:ribonuclease III
MNNKNCKNADDFFQNINEEYLDSEKRRENLFKKVHVTRKELESLILPFIKKKRIRNINLYRKALVHKSIFKIVNSIQNNREKGILPYYFDNNERLEFLGDSILGACVSEFLYTKYNEKDEGFLTRIKTKIVCGKNLSIVSKKIGLEKHLLVSEQILKINNGISDKLLEDCFESLIGAIYLDLGFDIAREFVFSILDKFIDFNNLKIDKNFKDQILRYSQFKKLNLPIYSITSEEGPSHRKIFEVCCVLVEDNEIVKGF